MADQSSTSRSVGFRIQPCGKGATELYGPALTLAGVCDGYKHHQGKLQALYNVDPTKRWLLPEKSLTGRRLFCVPQFRTPVRSIEQTDGVRSWLVSRPQPETQGQEEVLGPYKTVLERAGGVPTLRLTDLRGGKSAVYSLESDPTRVEVRDDPQDQESDLDGSFWELGSSLIGRPDPSELASTSTGAKHAADVSSGPSNGSASQVQQTETPKTAILRVAQTKKAQRDASEQWLNRNLGCETKSPSRTDLSCCLPTAGLTFDKQVNLDYAKGLMSRKGSEILFAVSNGKTSYATNRGPTDMTGTLLIMYPPTTQGASRAAARITSVQAHVNPIEGQRPSIRLTHADKTIDVSPSNNISVVDGFSDHGLYLAKWKDAESNLTASPLCESTGESGDVPLIRPALEVCGE